MTVTPEPQTCCHAGHTCGKEATSRIRVIPTRTDTPACPHTARALVWPGLASPVDVWGCAAHRDAVKSWGRILAETPMADAATVRVVQEDAG